MICSKCGRILKDDDVFCSSCGARVEQPKNMSSSNANREKTMTTEFHVDEIRWDLNGYPKEEVKRRETATFDWSMVVDERDRKIAEMNRVVEAEPEITPVERRPEEFATEESLADESVNTSAIEESVPEEEIAVENFADIEASSVSFVPEFKKEKSFTMEVIEEPAPERKPEIKEVSLEEVFEGVESPKADDWKKDATVRMSMDRKKAMRNKKPAKFTHGESIFHTARGMDEVVEDTEASDVSVADDVRDIVPPLNKAGSIFYTGQDNEEIGAATQLHIPRDTSYEGTNTFVAERKDIADAIQDVSVDRNEFGEEDIPYVSRDTYDDLDDIEDTPRQRLLGGIMGWGDKIKSLGSRFDDDDDRPSRREYEEPDDFDDDDDYEFDDKAKSKLRSFLDKITGLDVERERAEESGYNRFSREAETASESERSSFEGAEDMFLSESEREAMNAEPRNQRAHISPVRPAVKAGVVTAGISRNTAVQDFQKDIAEASAGGITQPVEKKRNPDDKFYTFNQKSEEFRTLLDAEYERLRQRIKDESEPGIGAELEARMNSYVPRRERIKEQEEALDIQELDEAAAVSEAPAAEDAIATENTATVEDAEEVISEVPASEFAEDAAKEAMEEVAPEAPAIATVEAAAEDMEEVAPEEASEITSEEIGGANVEEAPAAENEIVEEPPAPVIEEEEEEEEEFIWTDVPDEDIDVELASTTTDEVEPEEDEVVIVNDISQIIPESLDDENLTQTGRRRARRTLLQDIFAGNEAKSSEEPAEDDYNQIVSEETEKELMDFERRIDQMESEFESETGIERKKIPATRKPHTFAPAIPTGDVDAEERIRRTAMGTPSTEENVGTDDQIPEHVNKAPENKVQSVKARESEKPVVYAGPVKKEKNLYKEEPHRNTKAIALDVLIALLLIGIILVSILVFGRNTAVGQKLQEILGLKAEEVVEEVVPETVTETETETAAPVLSAIETAIKETKDRNTGIGDVAEDTALKFDLNANYGFDGIPDSAEFTDKDWYSTDDGNVVRVAPALVGAAQEYYSKLLDRMNTGSDGILDFLDETSNAYWEAAEYGPTDGVTYEFPKLQIGEIRQNGDIYYMLVRLAQKSNVDENLSTKVQIMQFNTEYNTLAILNVLDVADDDNDFWGVDEEETQESTESESVETEEEVTYEDSEEETYVEDTETTEDGE